MKKFLLTILIAIIIGGCLGLFIFKKMNSKDSIISTVLEEKVYAFQVGVFTELDNANILASKYSGIIIPDNDKYRVYIAIASSSNILNILKKYFDNKGIAYYVKEIPANDNFILSLSNYEELFAATTETNYPEIINNILKEYQKDLI